MLPRIRYWYSLLRKTVLSLVAAFFTLAGALTLLRDEFLSTEVAGQLRMSQWLPNIAWYWWIITALVVTIGALLEGSYREHHPAQKLNVTYDNNIDNCNGSTPLANGRESRFFRLKVVNTTPLTIYDCIGAVIEITNLDTKIKFESGRLIWATMPSGQARIELPPKAPHYLELCAISDDNKITISTEGGWWPLGAYQTMFDRPASFLFSISVSGKEAPGRSYSTKLIWTGDWKTTRMVPC